MKQLAIELGWGAANTTPVDLMVLSACRTALGSKEAELGFAGLAVQAGVKSAIASLWYVSDAGTLALMTNFYNQFKSVPNKSEALRRTQLDMLEGRIRVVDRQLRSPKQPPIDFPPDLALLSDNLSHPFYWSAFTPIGNWN